MESRLPVPTQKGSRGHASQSRPKRGHGVTGSRLAVATQKGSRGHGVTPPSPDPKGVTGSRDGLTPPSPDPKGVTGSRGHASQSRPKGVTGSRLPVPTKRAHGVTGSRLPVPTQKRRVTGLRRAAQNIASLNSPTLAVTRSTRLLARRSRRFKRLLKRSLDLGLRVKNKCYLSFWLA